LLFLLWFVQFLPCFTTIASFFFPPHTYRHLHSFPTRRSSDLGSHAQFISSAGKPNAKCSPTNGTPYGNATFPDGVPLVGEHLALDRKSTRLNSSHVSISYAVFCLKKKILIYESFSTLRELP